MDGRMYMGNGPVIEASIVHTRSGLIRLRFVQQVRRELLAGSLLEFSEAGVNSHLELIKQKNVLKRLMSGHKGTSVRLCSYVVKYDTGFAPNPFWGFCTLAACTPNHQEPMPKTRRLSSGTRPSGSG